MSLFTHNAKNAILIQPLTEKQFPAWLKKQSKRTKQWVEAQRFAAKPDSALAIPHKDGGIERIIAGIEGTPHIWALAHLPLLLPTGIYSVDADWSDAELADVALGFALAQYQFDRYRKAEKKTVTLALPSSIKLAPIERKLRAIKLTRDLINTPTNDMGPDDLSEAARAVAKHTGAKFEEIVGDDLLKKNYPAIHAVGRASAVPPRLIRLTHGEAKHPLVVLIGKGVCFDTGGLDLKPYAAMKLMKKDMGGAACMLGLFQLLSEEKLPVRLMALIPAVENSVSGNAFRPQDIINTRKGLTMEIGSTDAEGRVILADALADADSLKPDLIIDIATLTGAARTALGAELPALYSNRDALAQKIVQAGTVTRDPLWHMPLWQGYAKYVNSPIADVTNSPNYAFAGSITAALFLERFVSSTTPWVHIDSYAWNPENAPGRPLGGEALCLRALFEFLSQKYSA